MSTRDLIDAIEAGDSIAVQDTFEQAVTERIAVHLDTMRQNVAKSMFDESCKKKKMTEEDSSNEEATSEDVEVDGVE